MPFKTIFTCDRCGQDQEIPQGGLCGQYATITTALNWGYHYKADIRYVQPEISQVWCRDCLMSIGIAQPRTEEDKAQAPDPQPSLEDRIIAVLRELGFVQDGDLPRD